MSLKKCLFLKSDLKSPFSGPAPCPFEIVAGTLRYHNQCFSPGNVSCGTTTSATYQYVTRYHNQCISPGNVSYGSTTSVFNLAMCYPVPQPVYFTWQCVMRYHKQCISLDIESCGTTTSVFHLHYVIRYHYQCISPGNVLCGTTTIAT